MVAAPLAATAAIRAGDSKPPLLRAEATAVQRRVVRRASRSLKPGLPTARTSRSRPGSARPRCCTSRRRAASSSTSASSRASSSSASGPRTGSPARDADAATTDADVATTDAETATSDAAKGDVAPATAGTSTQSPAAPAPAPDSSFDGLDFANWGAGHPPDTNGDVGPTYYIQTINSSIGIYDKSTGTRVAAFTFNAFMSQGHFGNLCDTDNFGDPVVLYDSFEDRWFITDFAFKLDGVRQRQSADRRTSASPSRRPATRSTAAGTSTRSSPRAASPTTRSSASGRTASTCRRTCSATPRDPRTSRRTCGRSTSSRCTRASRPCRWSTSPGRRVDFTLLPANARLQDGHPAGGLARVLRLDRAVPERALDLQAPRRLGQDLDLDVHRAEHAARAELLAERACRRTRRRPPTQPTSSRSGPWRRRSTRTIGGAESLWVDHTVQPT